jgi:hypothetical protein
MDGFMYGRIVQAPLATPFMFMHSVSAMESAWINDWFYENSRATSYMLKIRGTTHANYGDLSLFDGIFRSRGVLGAIDGVRCIEIQRAYTLAFFAAHLTGERPDLLAGPSPEYPEVEFVSKSGTVDSLATLPDNP